MNYLYEYSDMLNRPYEAFVVDTLRDGFPVRPHFHHYVEIIYMMEGNMFATSDDTEYYVNEGDMLLFYDGSIHSMSASSVKGARYAVIKFDASRLTVSTSFTPRLATLLAAARNHEAEAFFRAEMIKDYGFKELFLDCVEELNRRELGYDVIVHAALCIIMTRLIRLWQEMGIDFTEVKEHTPGDELTVRNILEYIDLHMDEGLKVEDLAVRCSMSYSHFARCFKEMYGRSCKEYLEMLRVGKAEELLKFTDMPLYDISQELGYSDQSHFIRSFKKLRGVTPGNLRLFQK